MKSLIFSFFLALTITTPSIAQNPCAGALAHASRSPLAPLLIVSGPSGAGKTTVLRKVISESAAPVRTAVAVTTRAPRPGEKNGEAYHFWTKADFEKAKQNGDFLEWAEVHGNFYGTLKSEVDSYRKKGIAVVLVIDVQGTQKVSAIYPESVTVFLRTSTEALLEKRLRDRGTETEEAILKRLKNSKQELKFEKDYAHTVINDDLNAAVSDLGKILKASYN